MSTKQGDDRDNTGLDMAAETTNIFEISSRGAEEILNRRERCGHLHAIKDALAILDAIGQGGLLEAMPEDEADRARFQTGIRLLDILEQRLRLALENPDALLSDEHRRD
jgi:hypothetical protein